MLLRHSLPRYTLVLPGHTLLFPSHICLLPGYTVSLLRHTLLLPGHTLLRHMHTRQLTRHTLCASRSVPRLYFCPSLFGLVMLVRPGLLLPKTPWTLLAPSTHRAARPFHSTLLARHVPFTPHARSIPHPSHRTPPVSNCGLKVFGAAQVRNNGRVGGAPARPAGHGRTPNPKP